LKIIVGFWDSTADMAKIRERLGANCFDAFVTRLEEAKSQIGSANAFTEDGAVAAPKRDVTEAVPVLKA
jgi:hypothetical protein